MTYKFPQFNIEIIDPSLLVSLNTIQDRAIDKLLSVFVILTTDTAEFGVIAENMPYVDTWDDADVPDMVNIWLAQYEV
jgi:ssDNA-specific exonuclease RecJ